MEKNTGAYLIVYGKKLLRWFLAYCLLYEIGQLVRYSFKLTSTHRFKQEGCISLETVELMQFSTTT